MERIIGIVNLAQDVKWSSDSVVSCEGTKRNKQQCQRLGKSGSRRQEIYPRWMMVKAQIESLLCY